MSGRSIGLEPYVPPVAAHWEDHAPGSLHRVVDGSLVFVDISGFTALSERLAQRGRIGAEELTTVLDRVFGQMLQAAHSRGGALLKFGGDALLILFQSEDHPLQACAATLDMRSTLRQASKERTSVGKINLSMSSGIHSGPIDLFLVGDSHRELIVTGPAATSATLMEGTADAGEIVVSGGTRDRVPVEFAGRRKGEGWLLSKRNIDAPTHALIASAETDDDTLDRFVPTRLVPLLRSGAIDSEHRTATIGFLKFKGVDALLSERGAGAVADALDEIVRTVQHAAATEEVTFLASDIDADGGKMILAAGVPVSQHDDEGRMLRTARAILDSAPELTVRMGVGRGHVFAGNVGASFRKTYTVMGDTVNLTARLMAAAGPGQLYVAPSVLDHSATLFRTEALEAFQVKGKQEAVHAYLVHEEVGVRPPELHHELPFHGRTAELDMIVGIVTTCARIGKGGTLTISGAVGVGKSRLIAEVLDRCPGLAQVLIQAEPNGADSPYWALRDPLRRLLGIERATQDEMAIRMARSLERSAPHLVSALPLIADVLQITVEDTEDTAAIEPRFRPERTAEAIIDLLAAIHDEPLVVVAEDGQWLDAASHALLVRIGEAAASRPWTVIVTARVSDTDFTPVGDEVRLVPLDDDTIRAIAIEATAAAPLLPHSLERVVTRAGGSPLFLAEILNVISSTGSADELPDSLDAVVSTEIDTLPPMTRRLLRYSSVLGRSFRREVLAEFLAPDLIEFDTDREEELARFLEPDADTRMRFRHAVVHEIAYQGLSYRRRRELHARAGEVIERMAADAPDSAAEALAFHYSEAGAYEKVWHYAQIAGDKAKHAYANVEAATHYQRSIEAAGHLQTPDTGLVAELWIRLSDVRELAGQMEEARDALSHALRVANGGPSRRADILLRRAGTWLNSGNLTQAKRSITLGRKGLRPESSPTHLARSAQLDAFEASIHATAGDPVRAAKLARKAIDRATKTNQEEALARAYSVLDWANFVMGEEEPRRGPDAIEIYQRIGQLERSVSVMNNLGAFAYLEGNWDEAIEWYEKSLDAARRSGNVVDTAIARANIAEVMIGQGRYQQAMPLLAEARRIYEAANARHFMPLVELLEARVQIGIGNFDEAAMGLTSVLGSEAGGQESPWSGEISVALAEALIRDGRTEAAMTQLDEIESSGSASRATVLRLRGLGADSSGDVERALDLLEEAARSATEAASLYEELLALEVSTRIIGRAGDAPDPTDIHRLEVLRQTLGAVAPVEIV